MIRNGGMMIMRDNKVMMLIRILVWFRWIIIKLMISWLFVNRIIKKVVKRIIKLVKLIVNKIRKIKKHRYKD